LTNNPERNVSLRVLIVDDDRTLREGCASILRLDGYNVTVAGRGEEALDLVKRRAFDVMLVDLHMAGVSGMDIAAAALQARRETLVILMTGNPSVSSSIEALQAGAWDYLPKPFSATQLQVLVGRAAHLLSAKREPEQPTDGRREVFKQASHGDSLMMIGVSPAFREAVDLALRVAPTSAAVMITGESGTGKELIAQLIHQNSRRAAKTLVPINCAALPEPLLESELFGHRKGAFTGAERDKPGLLEVAHEGTLFLDELTEMPLPLQAKLLRVVQDGVIRRVGSEQRDAIVDVRFVSATNREPEEAMRAGILREDLYYRLRVVPIRLPALRHRVEDIPLLANHFLAYYWRRHRLPTEALPTLSKQAIEHLCARPWRGNVRELQNVIEHLTVLATPGRPIQREEIAVHTESQRGGGTSELVSSVTELPYHDAKDRLLAQFEKEYLARLLVRAGGNMSKAARLARMDRTTLYRLWEKHNGRPADPEASVAAESSNDDERVATREPSMHRVVPPTSFADGSDSHVAPAE
jgi:DNA-binding NtrC family response regulator